MKKIFSIILLLVIFEANCRDGHGLLQGIFISSIIIVIPFFIAYIIKQFKEEEDDKPLYITAYNWKNIIISSVILSFVVVVNSGKELSGNLSYYTGYCMGELVLFSIAYKELFIKKDFHNKDNDKKTEVKTSEKTSKKNTNDFLCLACGKKIGCDDTFCKHCGKKIKRVLKYCKYCGNKLNANFECEKCGKKYKNDDFLFVIFFLSLIIIGFALLIYALNS